MSSFHHNSKWHHQICGYHPICHWYFVFLSRSNCPDYNDCKLWRAHIERPWKVLTLNKPLSPNSEAMYVERAPSCPTPVKQEIESRASSTEPRGARGAPLLDPRDADDADPDIIPNLYGMSRLCQNINLNLINVLVACLVVLYRSTKLSNLQCG